MVKKVGHLRLGCSGGHVTSIESIAKLMEVSDSESAAANQLFQGLLGRRNLWECNRR